MFSNNALTKTRKYLGSLSLVLLCILNTSAVNSQVSAVDYVDKYELSLEPDLNEKSISGTLLIHVNSRVSSMNSIELNAGNLNILSVSHGGSPLNFEKSESILSISIPGGLSENSSRIQIEYEGKPRFGMRFSDDGAEVSTAFSTSQWMPAIDSPGSRAQFDLTLIIPSHFLVAATGELVERQELPGEKSKIRWLELSPMPSYLFGFAAGEFSEFIDRSQVPTLRYLAPTTFSPEQLETIFKDTRDMIQFFEDKSGINYPSEVYTQVLLRNGSGQELNGMAVMGERYGSGVLADETSIWLGVHEVVHQWWGNNITNLSWAEFWLNEGLGSFMTAAYLEHRFGRSAYEENIQAAREQYENLQAAGYDKPLVFPNWLNPSREDRSIVYDKGSYVVHLLRELLEDEAFWEGIRHYSQKHWGESVSSGDFQSAMEESSGVDLSDFFDTWVY